MIIYCLLDRPFQSKAPVKITGDVPCGRSTQTNWAFSESKGIFKSKLKEQFAPKKSPYSLSFQTSPWVIAEWSIGGWHMITCNVRNQGVAR